MKTFFHTFFVLFAAVPFMAFAADPEFDKDDPASVREFAGKGNPEAQYYLGLHFEAENNMAEAAQWFRKAADQGDLDAQYKLGVCYENGTGVPRDDKKAFDCYRNSAEKGIVDAQFSLGACYENGKGVGKDVKEAVEWYRKAADRKITEAQYRLGYCFENYSEVRSEDKAAIWYRRAAENGHAGAQYKIAQFYEEGRGVEKKLNEAIPWYTKAAEQGNLDAQIRLGKYYETVSDTENSRAPRSTRNSAKAVSKGSPLDMAAAIRWYAKAAEQGYQDENVFYTIGSCYENGKYVKENVKEAFDWYRKAAKLGHTGAQYKVGFFYESGIVVKRNLTEAFDWYRLAAELGSEEARVRLDQQLQDATSAEKKREEEAARKAMEERVKKITVRMSGEKTVITFPIGFELELIKVEAGTFEMSRQDGENQPSENPHQATLTRDFYIGRTEVTQMQWVNVMGSNPSRFKGYDHPVDQVSWDDAMAFCEKLNSSGKAPDGWRFSLPTETQWEYAARGGNKSKGYKYSGSNNIDEVAWYQKNDGRKSHPIGQKNANELGLYDMSGNVQEWCLDDWNDDSSKLTAEFSRENDKKNVRVAIRGGYWNDSAERCRAGHRGISSSAYESYLHGFRLALVPDKYQ